MDWNRVEGNWNEVKGKVKEKWGKLTDDDLTAINGQRDQLEGRLQQRYGYGHRGMSRACQTRKSLLSPVSSSEFDFKKKIAPPASPCRSEFVPGSRDGCGV